MLSKATQSFLLALGEMTKGTYVQGPVPLSQPLGQSRWDKRGECWASWERTPALHCHVGVRTPPAGRKEVPSVSWNLATLLRVPKPIGELVRWLLCLFSSICQSLIFNADREFFPMGSLGLLWGRQMWPLHPFLGHNRAEGLPSYECHLAICEHPEASAGGVAFQ